MKRDQRFDSPSTYADYLEAVGRIADANIAESVWLSEDELVGVYQSLESMDRQKEDANQSRARRFLEMLSGELTRMETAATTSGDESILYSPQYTRVTTAMRQISASRLRK